MCKTCFRSVYKKNYDIEGTWKIYPIKTITNFFTATSSNVVFPSSSLKQAFLNQASPIQASPNQASQNQTFPNQVVEDPSSVSEEMKKKIQTVLLVDDIPLNLKLLQVLCRKFGISEILLAGNGKEALNILKTNSTVDLVLTDLWMPEMNGEELVNKIREQKCFIKLPIYAVTADITAPKRFSLEKFSGIIYKPVTFDKIIKILSEISS